MQKILLNQLLQYLQERSAHIRKYPRLPDCINLYITAAVSNSFFASRPSSEEVFAAVPGDNKEMHVIPEASHFDMYDLAPFVSEAFDFILPFFGKNL